MYDMPRTLDRTDSGVVASWTPDAAFGSAPAQDAVAASDTSIFVVIADIAAQPRGGARNAPWLSAIGALGLAVETEEASTDPADEDLVDLWIDAAGVWIAVPATALQSAALMPGAVHSAQDDPDACYLSDRAALRPLVSSWRGTHVIFLGSVRMEGAGTDTAPRTAIQARVEATAQEIADACDASGVRCSVLRPAQNAALPASPRPSEAVSGRVLMLTPAMRGHVVSGAAAH